jgi:hypothetical protein
MEEAACPRAGWRGDTQLSINIDWWSMQVRKSISRLLNHEGSTNKSIGIMGGVLKSSLAI